MSAGEAAVIAEVHHLTDRVQFLEAELAKWKHEATHDPLTELLNRRGLFEAVGNLRTEGCYLVFVIDGNGVKAVNDTEGHAAGDLRIREIAEQIGLSTGGTGISARTGGDEFVHVCRPFGDRGPGTLGSCELYAVGVSLWQSEVETLDDALLRADAAMYESKPHSTRPLVPAQRSPQ